LADGGVRETLFLKGPALTSLYFKIKTDQIIGMDFHIPNPEDKRTSINAQDIYPEKSIWLVKVTQISPS
jgi:hypothetical protein